MTSLSLNPDVAPEEEDKSSHGDGSTMDETMASTRGQGEEATILSEKARGKMRDYSRRGSLTSNAGGFDNVEDEDEVEEMIEEFVGKNGFVPTDSWASVSHFRGSDVHTLIDAEPGQISTWRDFLPLDNIQIVLSELVPQILSLPDSPPSLPLPPLPSTSSLALLRTISLQDVLPLATGLQAKLRPFVLTQQSVTWLASLVYGNIYLGSLETLRVVKVGLFAVGMAPKAQSVVEIAGGFLGKVIA